ncbi:MAG: DegT/DnrJ/EryC1/StrS aminotransferase family protein [Alphaproteobacteria bacterium]|nr:DegT/DnrJ/EryC1/StrS aminotransferase family protein [Alphaproteobacteria bacterium]
MLTAPLPFIDLQSQRARIGQAIDVGILRVAAHGQYIMGPEVKDLEEDLKNFCGAKHCITVANGTEALAMPLMAKHVRPGEAILVPSFTFAATAEVVAWLGATPVFVDVDQDTFTMTIESLEVGITKAKALGLKPVAVIPVDLFGQAANYDLIEEFAAADGLWVMSDAAQSFGGAYKARKIGTIGQVTATSFFPSKPLGCYGDGGAIFTDDDEMASVLKSLRVHGQGSDKYDNVRIGLNARLDTMQAAVLIEKLKILEDEIKARNEIAMRYSSALSGNVQVPVVAQGNYSAWAQYTIRVPAQKRPTIMAALKEQGIPTMIYYPKPLHRQTAYRDFPVAGNGLPVSERLADEVLSLPMHPYLDHASQNRIVETLISIQKAHQ